MSCSQPRRSLSLAVLSMAFGVLAHTAVAAPQILALVASKGDATPMACVDGKCRAELTSFCLQQSRSMPAAGTVYHAISPSDLTLIVERADGTMRQVPAGDLLALTSARGNTSVYASLDSTQVARLGAVELSVMVGERASLLPAPEPGDVEPQMDQEVAFATATLRALGARLVDDGGGRIEAARATNLLVNSLPAPGQSASSGPPVGAWSTATAWRAAAGSGQSWANQMIEGCAAKPWAAPLRHCLRRWHDFLMRELNHDYWKAVRTGS